MCVVRRWYTTQNIMSSKEATVVNTDQSPFYVNLVENENCNINFNISRLVAIVEEFHEMKFMHTLINSWLVPLPYEKIYLVAININC